MAKDDLLIALIIVNISVLFLVFIIIFNENKIPKFTYGN